MGRPMRDSLWRIHRHSGMDAGIQRPWMAMFGLWQAMKLSRFSYRFFLRAADNEVSKI